VLRAPLQTASLIQANLPAFIEMMNEVDAEPPAMPQPMEGQEQGQGMPGMPGMPGMGAHLRYLRCRRRRRRCCCCYCCCCLLAPAGAGADGTGLLRESAVLDWL
jgi:hypothetical protein